MSLLAVVFSFLMFVVIVVAVVNELYAYKLGVVPMPTLPWIRKRIIDVMLEQDIKTGANIYELGSGWGGLAHSVARSFPDSQVTGVELSPGPFIFAKLFYHAKNLRFQKKDIFKTDISDADVLVFYLATPTLEQLKPYFLDKLQSGTLIISNGFEIPGWSAEEIIPLKSSMEGNLYLYRI